MKLSALTTKNIKAIVWISLLSSAATFFWGLSAGWGVPIALRFHVPMGFLASFIIGSTEMFVLNPIGYRLPFALLLILRTFLYVFVTFAAIIILAPLADVADLATVLSGLQDHKSVYSKGFIFGTIVSFVFSLIYSLQSILGKGTLSKLLVGSYHRPSEQQRIFMFLDVKSSTSIAEEIGHRKFMLLLNDFYYHISSAVIMTNGEIYKYVGDEIIVTWPMEKGIQNANCIQCFFDVLALIDQNRNFYLDKFGFVPEFRAGIHGGTVVAGMLGAQKVEIAYLGDVLNTTSRIQAECRKLNEQFLISGEILDRITLPTSLKPRQLGSIKLRGKEQEVELYSVDMKATLG
ncbi:MAG: hypothetical protein A2040_05305 [Rhodocyclales bacterium GWA2_65_19]|nr:MAG: hypothetical protein A2040_05305 [Rhodocyclales bacterium GWA2_65_19]